MLGRLLLGSALNIDMHFRLHVLDELFLVTHHDVADRTIDSRLHYDIVDFL